MKKIVSVSLVLVLLLGCVGYAFAERGIDKVNSLIGILNTFSKDLGYTLSKRANDDIVDSNLRERTFCFGDKENTLIVYIQLSEDESEIEKIVIATSSLLKVIGLFPVTYNELGTSWDDFSAWLSDEMIGIFTCEEDMTVKFTDGITKAEISVIKVSDGTRYAAIINL